MHHFRLPIAKAAALASAPMYCSFSMVYEGLSGSCERVAAERRWGGRVARGVRRVAFYRLWWRGLGGGWQGAIDAQGNTLLHIAAREGHKVRRLGPRLTAPRGLRRGWLGSVCALAFQAPAAPARAAAPQQTQSAHDRFWPDRAR